MRSAKRRRSMLWTLLPRLLPPVTSGTAGPQSSLSAIHYIRRLASTCAGQWPGGIRSRRNSPPTSTSPARLLTSAGTPPVPAGTFFTGHQCWSLGLGANYPQAGCEHFGVSLTKTPVATTYRWIVGDPSTGVLTYADGTALPTASSVPPSPSVSSVPILAPAAQIVAGQVEAVIQAPAPAPPPPAALAHRYGLAQWVKVYKKEIRSPCRSGRAGRRTSQRKRARHPW